MVASELKEGTGTKFNKVKALCFNQEIAELLSTWTGGCTCSLYALYSRVTLFNYLDAL